MYRRQRPKSSQSRENVRRESGSEEALQIAEKRREMKEKEKGKDMPI